MTTTCTVDERGRFGKYGGQFIPEILFGAVQEVLEEFKKAKQDQEFERTLIELLQSFAGRPTPLTLAENLSGDMGCEIYLKREDLLHTGAHKLNNALGQALLAARMGKRRLIAETGAGQHGVAVATAAAKLGLEAEIYMGAVDMERQSPNVFRMKLLGARVTPVETGSQTLKDAINEALRDWAATSHDSHYLIGSVLGPHPYPEMVAHFQRVIGDEARAQFLEHVGRLPDVVVACVGGGSNAIGIFRAFLNDPDVKLVGVEAGGEGLASGKHAARFADDGNARVGVLHGTYSQLLQDPFGLVLETHSIAAGLDYPAIGPEHTHLRAIGRADYVTATDSEALSALQTLSQREGIIPALESSHALAHTFEIAKRASHPLKILVNLSGRGDKDLYEIEHHIGADYGSLSAAV